MLFGTACALIILLGGTSFLSLAVVFALLSILLFLKSAYEQRCWNASGSVGDYSQVFDLHTMISRVNQHGTLLEVNERFAQVLGYERQELLSQNVFETCYFEKDRSVYLGIRDKILRGQEWSGEVRLRAKNGAEIWTLTSSVPTLSKTGDVTGALMVRTDITEAKRAQKLDDFVQAFEGLTDQVAIFSYPEGRIVYLNKSARSLFGLTDRDVGTISLLDLSMQYDYGHVRKQITKLTEGKLDFVDFVLSLADEKFDVRVQQIMTASGGCRVIAYFRNRTRIDALEREKNQFVSTVSHELRTPLTSIKGALGLSLSTGLEGVPERVKDLLNIAHRNADRLILIVNDILDLEKIDADQMQFDLKNVSLKEIAIDAIQANQPYFDELGVKVELELSSPSPMASLDRDRTMQVLTNLLSNAAKFSPADATIHLNIWENTRAVGFSVVDQGVGIPKSEIQTIFERFRQVKNTNRASMGGTGLGLAIVQSIVQKHGGEVSIESVEGSGTTVHCTFPAVSDMSEKPASVSIAS